MHLKWGKSHHTRTLISACQPCNDGTHSGKSLMALVVDLETPNWEPGETLSPELSGSWAESCRRSGWPGGGWPFWWPAAVSEPIWRSATKAGTVLRLCRWWGTKERCSTGAPGSPWNSRSCASLTKPFNRCDWLTDSCIFCSADCFSKLHCFRAGVVSLFTELTRLSSPSLNTEAD